MLRSAANLFRDVEPTEWVLAIIATGLILLLIFLHVDEPYAGQAWVRIAAVFGIIIGEQFVGLRIRNHGLFQLLRAGGSFFFGFILYQAVGYIIIGAGLPLHDDWLIAADRWMLGGRDIAVVLEHLVPVHRAIVELLQSSYDLYYLLPIIVGFVLYYKRARSEFEHFRAIVLGVLCGCFIGYLLIPAVGPRFALFEFANLDKDLGGLWITDWLRGWMNDGEGIKASMSSAEATRLVLRDCFPSGHVLISLMSATSAYRYRLQNAWLVAVGAFLVAFATMYLRYHYLVDVVVSTVLCIAIVGLERWKDSDGGFPKQRYGEDSSVSG